MSISPDASTAVAMIRAGLRGDDEGIGVLLKTLDMEVYGHAFDPNRVVELIAVLAGVATAIGVQALGDVEQFDAFLANWQEKHRDDSPGGYTDGDGTG